MPRDLPQSSYDRIARILTTARRRIATRPQAASDPTIVRSPQSSEHLFVSEQDTVHGPGDKRGAA